MAHRRIPQIGIFLMGVVVGRASLFSPVRELHDVEVKQVWSDHRFDAMIPAAENHAIRDEETVIVLCADGDGLPVIPGMVIEPLQYKQETGCMRIDADTYVDWLRDNNRNVVDREGRLLFAKKER